MSEVPISFQRWLQSDAGQDELRKVREERAERERILRDDQERKRHFKELRSRPYWDSLSLSREDFVFLLDTVDNLEDLVTRAQPVLDAAADLWDAIIYGYIHADSEEAERSLVRLANAIIAYETSQEEGGAAVLQIEHPTSDDPGLCSECQDATCI